MTLKRRGIAKYNIITISMQFARHSCRVGKSVFFCTQGFLLRLKVLPRLVLLHSVWYLVKFLRKQCTGAIC
jgi:hypothetical protein